MTGREPGGLAPEPRFRCSRESLALDEPLFATASTVRDWVLLEQPGPWSREAIEGSRLPPRLRDAARSWGAELGIRVVLIRRPGRHTGHGAHCFFVHTGPDAAWLEHAHVDDPGDLADLDLTPLARGERPGVGEPDREPVYLVCTHGRRDPCCAELGRPLARTLAASLGERVWESSHIGGDRFAGNLVCFPHGAYFGRVAPAAAEPIAARYAAGRLELAHYRGRSCYAFPVQAAEWFVRRDLDLDGVDDLALAGVTRAGRELRALFGTPAGAFEVAVRSMRRPNARRLTCHAETPARPRSYELVSVEGVEA